jgi:DNA polymerase I-like protein with 3'-5' exonuclease and polymerase domains
MRLAGFDVETWGTDPAYALQPFRVRTGDAWLTAAVFKAEGSTGLKALRSPKMVEKLRCCLKWAAKNNVTVVGWNTSFDCAWLIALGLREEVFACKWLDAMLLYKHIAQHPTFESYDTRVQAISFGLKAAVAQYLPDRAGYEKDVDFGASDPEILARLLEYNEMDVDCTLALTELFWKTMSADQRRAALIEAAAIPMVAEVTAAGISIDMAAVADLELSLRSRLLDLRRVLDQTAPELTDAALASPTQLRKILYTDWGLKPTHFTNTGAASTDREALIDLAQHDERAALVNEYRETRNNLTKFVVATRESVVYNDDGCIHPSVRIYGTYSGRFTVSTKIKTYDSKSKPSRKKVRTPESS